MTETNFEIELKKRGKRRLIGAIILTLVSIAALPFLIKESPPDINQGLIVNIIDPDVPKNAFDIEPLDQTKRITPLPNLLDQDLDKLDNGLSSKYLQTPPLKNDKNLQNIYKSLNQKKLDYQKSEISSGGKTQTTLRFGPFQVKDLEKYITMLQPIVGEIKIIDQ